MKTLLTYIITAILLTSLISAQGIKDLRVCNIDNICSDEETHQNCPQDCLPGSKDSYCGGISDGTCDPDCSSQADPDCEPKITFTQGLFYRIFQRPLAELQGLREPMQRAYYVIIIGAVIVALSLIAASIILVMYLHKIIKEKKSQMQIK